MHHIEFSGLGTTWAVLIDEDTIPAHLLQEVNDLASEFEQKYSRFIPDSEISKINDIADGHHTISPELVQMLAFGLRLKNETGSAFDPNVAHVLEDYGYDRHLSLQRKRATQKRRKRGRFWLDGNTLITRGEVKLDLGSWGKGFLIDQIGSYLRGRGVKYFLVDGGGDMYGTAKRDGSRWNVALEHPIAADEAFGVIDLRRQAIAGSGSQKRKIGSFHHLIDTGTDQPVRGIRSVHVVAQEAMVADGAATAIFVSPQHLWRHIATTFSVEFLVIFDDLQFIKSPGFTADLFS